MGDIPGGPEVKTLHSQCRGTGLIAGWGANMPYGVARKTNKKPISGTAQIVANILEWFQH